MRRRRRIESKRFSRKLRQSLSIEPLESRTLLAGLVNDTNLSQTTDAQGQFQNVHGTRIYGPLRPAKADWIVQLSDEGTKQLKASSSIVGSLSSPDVDFELVRGLGAEGLLQVYSFGIEPQLAELALAKNALVKTFAQNQQIDGMRFPNDSDFGNQIGLHNVGQLGAKTDADVDGVEAWDVSTGSAAMVVGVIDSGIDLAHPDLYLNIWLNQGEIPVAKRSSLVDVDRDRLITFYDLNDRSNISHVSDLNANGYIDASDLLEDPRWADGIDTDANGFIDDFFGWNFRLDANEPFAPNRPADVLGHGTHVAGIIGAMGNNQLGVTGVNWQTSLMSLKFLDETNKGDLASAIAAVNYATMMRNEFDTNVRVLNNSWGQSGSPNTLLEQAIELAGESGILVVAAAGNGNVLGQGVNLDLSPFYPASFNLPNVLSVGASDGQDRLASFSNFGATTVDILAPGVGIRSTLPQGRYGEVNGTSMATPFVAGAAALIWSSQPQAAVSEVRDAILDSADRINQLTGVVESAGRLNLAKAINSAEFAPVAKVIAATDIITANSDTQEIEVVYEDKTGIDVLTIGDNDLIVHHRWGNRESLSVTLNPNSIVVTNGGKKVTATYKLMAPGGSWDPLDFGIYEIESVAGSVSSINHRLTTRDENIGRFQVRIMDPLVHYVTQLGESNSGVSLRQAIANANADPANEHLVILESAEYSLELSQVADPTVSFDSPSGNVDCGVSNTNVGWSNATTGDLDISGTVKIVGDTPQTTFINAAGIDRGFKVHPQGSLTLQRLNLSNGQSPDGQGGGGILSLGQLELIDVSLSNHTAGQIGGAVDRGGAIAAWGGSVEIEGSHITDNRSDIGGGIFVCGSTQLTLIQSTVDENVGGGVVTYSSVDGRIENSTIALNSNGAVVSRSRDFPGGNGSSFAPSISDDGQRVVYLSKASNLVAADTNALADAFLFDSVSGKNERISVATNGSQSNRASEALQLSGDGRTAIFASDASNLFSSDDFFSRDIVRRDLISRSTSVVLGANEAIRDTRGSPSIDADGDLIAFQQAVTDNPNNNWDVIVADIAMGVVTRVTLQMDNTPVDIAFLNQTVISGDGRYVAIAASESGTDDKVFHDIYVLDRQTGLLSLPELRRVGFAVNGSNFDPVLSHDGRFIAFVSDDSNLVDGDTNGVADIFVYDTLAQTTTLVSSAGIGLTANGASTHPAISDDGRFVAFQSDASNLVSGDMNGSSDVFIKDRISDSVQRISVGPGGVEANGSSGQPAISGNGKFIAFDSTATNLATTHPNHIATVDPNRREVYRFDRDTSTLQNISRFETNSTLVLEHVTLAFNQGEQTLEGNVTVGSSLLAGNVVTADFGASVSSRGHNVLASAALPDRLQATDVVDSISSTKLGPFQSIENLPPGYLLRQGNPAINSGGNSPGLNTDQWGRNRTQPDSGAFEAISGSLSGVVFVDYDGDLNRDNDEAGFPGVTVFIDFNNDGVLQPDEPRQLTLSPSGGNSIQNGSYLFGDILPNLQSLRVLPPEHWQASDEGIFRVAAGATQANGDSVAGVIDDSGQFIAFTSSANNLVPADTSDPSVFLYTVTAQSIEKVPLIGANPRALGFAGPQSEKLLVRDDTAVYFYDRNTRLLEPLSRNGSGELANGHSDDAAASADGRWIVFSSFANNLVPGDNDNFADIFIYDRVQQVVSSVTKSANGIQGNQDSENPTISGDGRYISFTSDATNLVPNDTNGRGDVFLFDQQLNTLRRLNTSPDGDQSNAFTYAPVISGNGQFIVFQSLANNLTADTVPGTTNLFVVQRATDTIERLRIPFSGDLTGVNFNPSISDDGQYIAFEAPLTLVDSSASATSRGVFVYDRFTDADDDSDLGARLRLISKSLDGQLSNGSSRRGKISGDGLRVVFDSSASDLVRTDTNQRIDLFTATNPFESASRPIHLEVGEDLVLPPIGLKPDPGTIRGTVYHDVSGNGVFDVAEPTLADWTVYLDLNDNLRLDELEPRTLSAADGSYLFSRVVGFRDYSVRVVAPLGWELNKSLSSSDRENIFLPAGGSVGQVDFGFKRQLTGGQSTNGRIQGSVFQDRNADGVRQLSEPAVAGVVVYLDLDGDELRDFDEPRFVTDSQGNYEFSNLGSRTFTVRTLLNEGTQLTTPIGNQFTSQQYPFSTSSTAILTPQDLTVADIDGTQGPDIIVALYSANAVAIQRNSGDGTFDSPPIIIETPAGQGPIALTVGNLNGKGSTDIAVANSLNQTITLLIDYQGNQFLEVQTISTLGVPTDINTGDMDADGDNDLLVLTRLADQSGRIEVFLNRGDGVFAAGNSISTNGRIPTSFVAKDFNQDQRLDFAITHLGDIGRSNATGEVRVVLSNGLGGHALPVAYPVGATPTSVDTSDLNGDGFSDLVVANFSVNTATLIMGNSQGTFTLSPNELAVGSGPVQVSLMDIDGDQDSDILIANLRSKTVSILRNKLSQQTAPSAVADFEAEESFGSAAFSVSPRLVFAGGDFDQSGTLDLALVNSESNAVNVFENKLIGGANRLALTGTQTVTNQNFGLKSVVLTPTIDSVTTTIHLLEDASTSMVNLTGIRRGYSSGPAIQWNATSSDESKLKVQGIDYLDGATTGTLRVVPEPDAIGNVTVRIQLRNAGADEVFNNSDDGVTETTVRFSIDAVNDRPSIQIIGDQVVTIGSPLRTVANYATGFKSGGGVDEQLQTISEYIVSNDHTELFIVQPRIDNQGTLRFQPSLTQTGIATVQVQVRDNGGIEQGGMDRSIIKTFKILVTDLSDGEIDFGDAPAATQSGFVNSYPTLLKDDGARHRVSSIYLGSAIDPESDGQADANALGDQADLFDEDGVIWIATPMADPNVPTLASVVVTASSVSKLDAWIDFNRDGDWNDSGEQVFASAELTAGKNFIRFTVPAGAATGKTFARFRVSTRGELRPIGEAVDGEVEDYAVNILDARVPRVLELSAETILAHEVSVRDGFLFLSNATGTIYASPTSAISSLMLSDGAGNVVYQIADPKENLFGTIQYFDRNTPVILVSSLSIVDINRVAGAISGIGLIKLEHASSQILKLDSSSVLSIAQGSNLLIQLGSGDQVESTENWSLDTLNLVGQFLEQVFKHNSIRLTIRSVAAFQNPLNAYDVLPDHEVLPIDALVIINYLNAFPDGRLPAFESLSVASHLYFDTDGNNRIEPIDVLILINYLNSLS